MGLKTNASILFGPASIAAEIVSDDPISDSVFSFPTSVVGSSNASGMSTPTLVSSRSLSSVTSSSDSFYDLSLAFNSASIDSSSINNGSSAWGWPTPVLSRTFTSTSNTQPATFTPQPVLELPHSSIIPSTIQSDILHKYHPPLLKVSTNQLSNASNITLTSSNGKRIIPFLEMRKAQDDIFGVVRNRLHKRQTDEIRRDGQVASLYSLVTCASWIAQYAVGISYAMIRHKKMSLANLSWPAPESNQALSSFQVMTTLCSFSPQSILRIVLSHLSSHFVSSFVQFGSHFLLFNVYAKIKNWSVKKQNPIYSHDEPALHRESSSEPSLPTRLSSNSWQEETDSLSRFSSMYELGELDSSREGYLPRQYIVLISKIIGFSAAFPFYLIHLKNSLPHCVSLNPLNGSSASKTALLWGMGLWIVYNLLFDQVERQVLNGLDKMFLCVKNYPSIWTFHKSRFRHFLQRVKRFLWNSSETPLSRRNAIRRKRSLYSTDVKSRSRAKTQPQSEEISKSQAGVLYSLLYAKSMYQDTLASTLSNAITQLILYPLKSFVFYQLSLSPNTFSHYSLPTTKLLPLPSISILNWIVKSVGHIEGIHEKAMFLSRVLYPGLSSFIPVVALHLCILEVDWQLSMQLIDYFYH